MKVSLIKGQKVSLTKARNLSKISVGLGWQTFNESADLDASAFLVDVNEKVLRDLDFVFYNNLTSSCGSVRHQGDDLVGGSGGDDETINVNLSDVPLACSKIVFTVTIHEAKEKRQNFGQVSNAFVRIIDRESNEELLRYDLAEDFSRCNSVIFCELVRDGNDWDFKAVGEGFNEGLFWLCKKYGVNV